MIRMQLHCPLGHACYTKRGKTLDVRIGSKPARAARNSGSLAMLAAMRRASSRVRRCAAERRPGSSSKETKVSACPL